MESKINGSDKNVACVEENIEGLKRLFYANALTQYGKRKLIEYYEQQIKELEENSIPVSSVKEKIEEINRKIKNEDNEKVIIWLHKQRKILQELLEKRK